MEHLRENHIKTRVCHGVVAVTLIGELLVFEDIISCLN